ncbi:hypothetical protein TrST_g7638 [Triparma strigata]|uniref:Mitochondrial proton/calcium exchanger protein n=1 Tax=Triparma strigata TaxID=1606541 RepID=A0A9W7AWC5_9STRA|nr:hypothetical protein TrST_g7638 [Triparma strigata]
MLHLKRIVTAPRGRIIATRRQLNPQSQPRSLVPYLSAFDLSDTHNHRGGVATHALNQRNFSILAAFSSIKPSLLNTYNATPSNRPIISLSSAFNLFLEEFQDQCDDDEAPRPSPSSSRARNTYRPSSSRYYSTLSRQYETPFQTLRRQHRIIQARRHSTAPPQKEKTTTPATAATPPSEPSLVTTVSKKTAELLAYAIKSFAQLLMSTPGVLYFYITHPSEFKLKMTELKEHAVHEAKHYYLGTKLLFAEVTTARKLLSRTLVGGTLTRRERKQLLRTTTDLFRLVPMSMFVLIPFMEFLLPFALKIFPNMLPSTFNTELSKEENMKKELKGRIAMAGFLQETLHSLAKEKRKLAEAKAKKRLKANMEKEEGEEGEDVGEIGESDIEADEAVGGAKAFMDFLDKARKGEKLPAESIIKFSAFFKDDLTLDSMSRMQLVNMCRYMGVTPYGSDAFLRFQLRFKIRALKEDDQRILWEGIGSLTKMELREACQERGMRSTGISKSSLQDSLQQWLDLSVNSNVPISLLIMSRTFFLKEEMSSLPSTKDAEKQVEGLQDVISGMDEEVVNEVLLEVATPEESRSDIDVIKVKLEVLEAANEKIDEEAEARQKAEEKKEREKKEKKAKEEKEEREEKELEMGEERVLEEAPESAGAEVKLETDAGAEVVSTKKSVDPVIFQEVGGSGPEKEIEIKLDEAKEAKEVVVEKEEVEVEEEEEDQELSAVEIEAIGEMLSADPVEKERGELERIKALLEKDEEKGLTPKKEEDDDEGKVEKEEEEGEEEEEKEGAKVDEAVMNEVETKLAVNAEQEEEVVRKSGADTVFTTGDEFVKDERAAEEKKGEEEGEKFVADESAEVEKEQEQEQEQEEEQVEKKERKSKDERNLDKSVKVLKSKVSQMLETLEEQLQEVEGKVGDKLQFLDKDGDGVLTAEELVEVLQTVMKRKMSDKEVMEIVSQIDEDSDGSITVDEVMNWVSLNKFAKEVEEDRYVDPIVEIEDLDEVRVDEEEIVSAVVDDKKRRKGEGGSKDSS